MNYERINKKDLIFCVIFVLLFGLLLVFEREIFTFIEIEFFKKNATFCAYLFFFIIALCLFGKILFADIRKVHKENVKKTLHIELLVFVFVLIIATIIGAIFAPQNGNQESIREQTKSNFWFMLIAGCIFAPVVEELIFRFCIFRCINQLNYVLAHIIVALLFGFFHVYISVLFDKDYIQLLNMVQYMIGSIGFSIVYQKTKSIIYPMLGHSAFNFVVTILQLFL